MPDQLNSKVQLHLHFFSFTKNILNGNSSLYLTHTIKNIGMSTLGIFVPLYIFQLENVPKLLSNEVANSILIVLSYYLVRSIFMTVFTGKLVNSIYGRLNFRKSIFLSTVILALYILLLALAKDNLIFLYIAAFANFVETVLYWVPFHLLFARNVGSKGHYGHEISSRTTLVLLANTLGPLLGGLIISLYGFNTLFIFSSVIIIASAIPIFVKVEDTLHGKHNASRAFLRFVRNPKYLNDTIAYGVESIEVILTPIFWTILLFLAIDSYVKIGLLKTMSIVPIMFLAMYTGKLIDIKGNAFVHRIGVTINSLLYIPRIFNIPVMFMYIVDISDRLNSVLYGIPFMSSSYERIQGSKHDSDYVIYREIARSGFSIIGILFAMIFVLVIDEIRHIFIPIAIIAPLTYLISKKK